ncbi:hypothetical protein QWA_17665 [Alcaligenes faecalis subsp. faecalis NCIB 8687]|nr:hypothetical protein QWA_17665 [Alcaligenes faecalis subsp. faecalis NCIB 8687]
MLFKAAREGVELLLLILIPAVAPAFYVTIVAVLCFFWVTVLMPETANKPLRRYHTEPAHDAKPAINMGKVRKSNPDFLNPRLAVEQFVQPAVEGLGASLGGWNRANSVVTVFPKGTAAAARRACTMGDIKKNCKIKDLATIYRLQTDGWEIIEGSPSGDSCRS